MAAAAELDVSKALQQLLELRKAEVHATVRCTSTLGSH